jgi:hypothetical protein
MTTNGDPPKEPERSSFLAAAIPLGLVIATVAAALDVFAGWRYTTEYYRQFGIEPSALDLSPYDYALRSWPVVVQIIGILISIALLAALYRFIYLPLKLPRHWPNETVKNLVRWLLFAATVSGVVFTVLGIFDDNLALQFVGVMLVVFAGAPLITLDVTAKPQFAAMVALALLLCVFAITTVGSGNRGTRDGQRDHENLNRLPTISIVAERELGLEHQGEAAGLPVYGPYRLILRNGGMYYLVSQDAPDETIAVPEDAVAHVKLHKAD